MLLFKQLIARSHLYVQQSSSRRTKKVNICHINSIVCNIFLIQFLDFFFFFTFADEIISEVFIPLRTRQMDLSPAKIPYLALIFYFGLSTLIQRCEEVQLSTSNWILDSLILLTLEVAQARETAAIWNGCPVIKFLQHPWLHLAKIKLYILVFKTTYITMHHFLAVTCAHS